MLNNHAEYKYETLHKGPFVITRFWTNGTVTMQYRPIKIRHNIRRIKPYKSDTNVEDITSKICVKISTYDHQLYTSVLYKILDTRYIIGYK